MKFMLPDLIIIGWLLCFQFPFDLLLRFHSLYFTSVTLSQFRTCRWFLRQYVLIHTFSLFSVIGFVLVQLCLTLNFIIIALQGLWFLPFFWVWSLVFSRKVDYCLLSMFECLNYFIYASYASLVTCIIVLCLVNFYFYNNIPVIFIFTYCLFLDLHWTCVHFQFLIFKKNPHLIYCKNVLSRHHFFN